MRIKPKRPTAQPSALVHATANQSSLHIASDVLANLSRSHHLEARRDHSKAVVESYRTSDRYDESKIDKDRVEMETALGRDARGEWSLCTAVDVLENIVRVSETANDAFARREELLEAYRQTSTTEVSTNDQQLLAYMDHMHSTIQLLNSELERERQQSSNQNFAIVEGISSDAIDPIRLPPPNVTLKPSSAIKRNGLSPALMRSPLASRVTKVNPRRFVEAYAGASQDWANLLGSGAENRLVRTRAVLDSATIGCSRLLPELESSQSELQAAAKLISTREEKLREILKERAHWQGEYQLMREQVVEEKMRQVELFHRLENRKHEYLRRSQDLERALHEAQLENQLVKSQLSEARVKIVHQQKALEDMIRQARDEKENLVCTIAETRHKFKEWKEGEAATLKAARDQAVHTLKTEYELKIARHHLEKQKLRDKVKDLEVSLRLLQKDRHLSPQELSLRKATILGNKDHGNTTEAELIEAHCRIKELEALLDHAKEYQRRQENIIRVSESTISRLVQEREVVALEHATLLQPLSSLASLGIASVHAGADSGQMTKSSSAASLSITTPLAATTMLAKDLAITGTVSTPNTNLTNARPGNVSVHSVTANRENNDTQAARQRRSSKPSASDNHQSSENPAHSGSSLVPNGGPNSSGSSSASYRSSDPEKDMLRRQSIVLSAEVEKYRHLVVQSLDEIRALKDNRRRSLMSAGSSSSGGAIATVREQYLMNELAKVQKDLDEMKQEAEMTSKTKLPRKDHSREQRDLSQHTELGAEDEERDDSCAESSDESDSCSYDGIVVDSITRPQTSPSSLSQRNEDISAIPSDHHRWTLSDKVVAAKIIQSRSKGYLLRRDFVRKKRAADKIKAQYRGYLVRKNMELLDRTHRPFAVTYPMQIKMQIVQPHYVLDTTCNGRNAHLTFRVSKDPPIVQICMDVLTRNTPESSSKLAEAHTPSPKQGTESQRAMLTTHDGVYFFHLFEIVALLPLEDETRILEESTESEIAELIASLLHVVASTGDYKFLIDRRVKHQIEDSPNPPAIPAITGSFLTPLNILAPTRSDSATSSIVGDPTDCPARLDTANPIDLEIATDLHGLVREQVASGWPSRAADDVDLDSLILLSRSPSAELKVVAPQLVLGEVLHTLSSPPIMRRRSSSLQSIPETDSDNRPASQ